MASAVSCLVAAELPSADVLAWIVAHQNVSLALLLLVATGLLVRPSLSKPMGDALKGLRVIVVEMLILFLIASVALLVHRAVRQRVITMEPISVAKSLAAQGYSDAAVTQQIVSEFQKIQLEARGNIDVREPVSQLAVGELVEESQLPDLQLPGTEFSLRSAIRYIKATLGGSDVRVGGVMLKDWSLRLWLNTGTSYVVAPPSSADSPNTGTPNLQEVASKGAQLLVDDISPCHMASYLHNKDGQREHAEASVRRCLARAQTNAERRTAYMIWAMILHYWRENEKAIEKYERAERYDKSSASLYVAWGNVHFKRARCSRPTSRANMSPDACEPNPQAYDLALAKYEIAEKLDNEPLRGLIKMNRGLVHYDKAGRIESTAEGKRREYDLAVLEYEAAVKSASDRQLSLVYTNLANVHRDYADLEPDARDKHLEAAQDAAMKAIDADPLSAYAFNALGTVLKRKADRGAGKFESTLADDALSQFRFAVEADPKFTEAHYNAGRVYWERHEFSDAQREFSEAIRCNPYYVDAYTGRGLVLIDLKQANLAIADFNRAKALDGQCVDAFIGLGRAFLEQKEFGAAVAELEAALRIRESADARAGLGEALLQQGQLDRAIEEFTKAKQLRPDSLHAYTGLGRALTRKGKLDEAVEVLSEAVTLNPDSLYVHVDLGETLLAKGELNEAANHLATAKQLDSRSPYVYAALGRLAEATGRKPAALEAYQQAIDLHHPDAEQLKARLRALGQRKRQPSREIQ